MGIKIRHTRALIGFLPIGFRVPIAIPTPEGEALRIEEERNGVMPNQN
jgi:hypothetical protein